MFGLEVFRGDSSAFYPDNYMTRAEFAAAMAKVAREVPQDPTLITRTVSASRRTTGKEVIISPFDDVSINNTFFSDIKSVFERGIMFGKGYDRFAPNDYTRTELLPPSSAPGFESLAPAPAAVTSFRIMISYPSTNAAYVAQSASFKATAKAT